MKLNQKSWSLSFFVVVGFLLLLSSCSMTFEKRHYRKGYHVEIVKKENRHINAGSTTAQTSTAGPPEIKPGNTDQAVETESTPDPVATTGTLHNQEKKVSINKKSVRKVPTHQIIKRRLECDVITLKDGTRIDAIIETIGEDQVTYKKCNFESGPSYTISLSKVDIISLRNGDYYRPKPTTDTHKPSGRGNGVGELVIGILAFVFALFAFVMVFIPLGYGFAVLTGMFGSTGFIMGIVGVILSAVKMNPENQHRTIPGLVLAALAILLFMIAIAILVI